MMQSPNGSKNWQFRRSIRKKLLKIMNTMHYFIWYYSYHKMQSKWFEQKFNEIQAKIDTAITILEVTQNWSSWFVILTLWVTEDLWLEKPFLWKIYKITKALIDSQSLTSTFDLVKTLLIVFSMSFQSPLKTPIHLPLKQSILSIHRKISEHLISWSLKKLYPSVGNIVDRF